MFCYSLKQNEEGAIYYYEHEFDYGDNPENHITLIATSIIDFIADMCDEE